MPTPLCTLSCTGMRSLSASTWLITPIILPLALRLSRASRATSRVSPSNVPKPSSRNSESMLVLWLTRSDSAKANARLTRKLSPPDRVLVSRAASACPGVVAPHPTPPPPARRKPPPGGAGFGGGGPIGPAGFHPPPPQPPPAAPPQLGLGVDRHLA